MTDEYEIIVIGYRWFWQRLERAIDSLVRTNTHALNIHVGLNSPEPEMLAVIEKYRDRLASVHVSDVNLNKVGMQRELVHRCTAKYIVSFDDDSFPIHHGWQQHLMQRVDAYESKTLRYFGDFGEEKEAQFAQMTGNTVGLLGLIFYEWLDEPKQDILAKCPWYDPQTKLNHEGMNAHYNKLQLWFCAGAFYTFLREPYVRFDYPGFAYRMKYEDVILSYFYQHHGYRLGDLGGGFDESGLDPKNRYAALGTRVILNAGQRTWDLATVETTEHSRDAPAYPGSQQNEYLMNVIDFLKTLPHVEPDDDYLNAADYYPFLNALARDFNAERVLEIGVRYGYSAVAFIHGNRVREYVGLDYDLYDPSSSTKSRANLDYVKAQQHVDVTLIKVNTQTLDNLDILQGRTFDFIHIDGDHSYEGALTDLRTFWNLLSVGGHMLVDDSVFYGSVRSACVEFAKQVDEPCYDVKTYRGTWVFLKTRARAFPIRPSAVNERTPAPAVTDTDVVRRFHATHPGWSGPLLLLRDGTFRGGMNSPDGTWSLDGPALSLNWYHWPPDVLQANAGGTVFVSPGPNVLTLSAASHEQPAALSGGNVPGREATSGVSYEWPDWFSQKVAVLESFLAPLRGQPAQGLEIGSWEGRSARWFLEQVLTHDQSRLVCIEPFVGGHELALPPEQRLAEGGVIGLEERLLFNLSPWLQLPEPRVELHQCFSWEALRALPAQSFDFAYVDGSHRTRDVMEDLVLTYRLLKPGGLLIADDYCWTLSPDRPGPAIDAFLSIYGSAIEVLHKGLFVVLRVIPDRAPRA